jgi:hypothetical protein
MEPPVEIPIAISAVSSTRSSQDDRGRAGEALSWEERRARRDEIAIRFAGDRVRHSRAFFARSTSTAKVVRSLPSAPDQFVSAGRDLLTRDRLRFRDEKPIAPR